MDARVTGEQWQLSLESARRYERVVVTHILAPWSSVLADAARLSKGERVLDLACGTGTVARVAAAHIGREGSVVGVDLNAGMIEVARSLPAPSGASIEWIEASALALPLPDGKLDVVLCQQGLQFFTDKLLALREMRRVLRPGGRIALGVWCGAGPYNGAVARALARFADESIARRFLASRAVPPREELERLAASVGFSSIETHVVRKEVRLPTPDRFVLEHLAATPIAQAIDMLSRASRDAIGSMVLEDMKRFVDGASVLYPEETHVLTALKQPS
jgi:ubiquinone/menaquinone biosynthesis C-methylase UbiE